MDILEKGILNSLKKIVEQDYERELTKEEKQIHIQMINFPEIAESTSSSKEEGR